MEEFDFQLPELKYDIKSKTRERKDALLKDALGQSLKTQVDNRVRRHLIELGTPRIVKKFGLSKRAAQECARGRLGGISAFQLLQFLQVFKESVKVEWQGMLLSIEVKEVKSRITRRHLVIEGLLIFRQAKHFDQFFGEMRIVTT